MLHITAASDGADDDGGVDGGVIGGIIAALVICIALGVAIAVIWCRYVNSELRYQTRFLYESAYKFRPVIGSSAFDELINKNDVKIKIKSNFVSNIHVKMGMCVLIVFVG